MPSTATQPAPVPTHAAPSTGELTHRQIVTILLGLMAGMFLAALDQNIVATAIRTISDDLNGLDQQAWVTTAYLITSTISTPIYGKLSDLYGRKPFFMAAITIFVIGSAACSFATSMYMLAAFRAFQGLGAGGLMSLALAIIGDIVPPRERAKYQGYFLAVFGTSSVLGPVIGGFFADQAKLLGVAGWRWVFLINVPIGIIALGLVSVTLHLHHVRRQAKIDWAGATTLVIGLVPLLLVAEQGRTWGWDSEKSVICYVIGAVGIILFVIAEYIAKDTALIPLRIFTNRAIVIALTGGFVVGAGMFGGIMLLPQFYLQIIHGSSPTTAGLQMLPMVIGMMIASIGSGQLMTRTGLVKPFPIIGVAVMVFGLLLLSRITADTELWQVMLMMFVFGFGLGNTMQPLTLAVQAVVDPRDIGMATSSATFFRQIGGTLGVAIFLSMMFNSLGDHIKDAFTAAAGTPAFQEAMKDPQVLADPTNASFVKALTSQDPNALAQVTSDSSIINHLDPRLAHPFKVGFADSMSTVFLVAACAVAVGMVVLLFMPRIHLSHRSAAARMADGNEPDSDKTPALNGGEAQAPETSSESESHVHHRASEFLLDAAAEAAGGHTLDELDSSEEWPEALAVPAKGLHGTVTDSGKKPLPGARVTLADARGNQVARTVADSAGRFVLPVEAGTYLAIVAAQGVAPHATLVTVGDGSVPTDVVLSGTAWISGRVLHSQVGDTNTTPLGGALVTLTDSSGQVLGSHRSSDDGGYVFERLRPGSYVLTAQSDAHRPFAKTVEVDGTDATIADLVLGNGGRLEGVILDAADRRPVGRAIVTLVDGTGAVAGRSITGPDGSYRFDDLTHGQYTLTASGYSPIAHDVHISDGRVSQQTVLLGDAGDEPELPAHGDAPVVITDLPEEHVLGRSAED